MDFRARIAAQVTVATKQSNTTTFKNGCEKRERKKTEQQNSYGGIQHLRNVNEKFNEYQRDIITEFAIFAVRIGYVLRFYKYGLQKTKKAYQEMKRQTVSECQLAAGVKYSTFDIQSSSTSKEPMESIKNAFLCQIIRHRMIANVHEYIRTHTIVFFVSYLTGRDVKHVKDTFRAACR